LKLIARPAYLKFAGQTAPESVTNEVLVVIEIVPVAVNVDVFDVTAFTVGSAAAIGAPPL
jgi:hypothetical protein